MVQVAEKAWKRKSWEDVVSIGIKYRDRERTYPIISIFRRTPAGKMMHEDKDTFPSYFYIPVNNKDELNTLPPDLVPESIEYSKHKSIDGEECIKLNYPRFSKVQFVNARDHFTKTFEDDLRYNLRYMCDNDIKFTTNRRICYFDIENDMSLDIVNAPKEILSIAVHDSLTKQDAIFVLDKLVSEKFVFKRPDGKVIIKFNNEKALLEEFIKYIDFYDPDILTAYNLYAFDWPYLINRMRRLGIDYKKLSKLHEAYCIVDEKDNINNRCNCEGRELIDYYVLFKKLYDEDKPEDFRLDSVGEKVLGMKKTKYKYKDVGELYRNDLPLFCEYNLMDVELMWRLEEKIGFITRYLVAVQQLIPMPLTELLHNSISLDFYILKTYHGKVIFPSKRKKEKQRFGGAITGALIEDPKTGKIISIPPKKKLYRNVGVVDFSGLYPNIFRTFNVSPDTLCVPGEPDSVTVDDIAFSQDRQGLLPALVENIITLRKKYQEELDKLDPTDPNYPILYNIQYGIKRLNNSLYGATGYGGFRLFDLRVAKSITFLGQELIKSVYLFLKNDLKREAIYFDTDSAFIVLRSKVEDKEGGMKEIEEIEHRINEFIQKKVTAMGCKENFLHMDFEKRFSSVAFMGVKKRYIGYADIWKGKVLEHPKFIVKGFDLVRREMPPSVKKIIKHVILMALEGKSKDEMREYYKKAVEEIKKLPVVQIAWTKSFGKNPDDYEKVLPQHIKAAQFSMDKLGIEFRKGDSPKIMYIRGCNYTRPDGLLGESDVFAFYPETELPTWLIDRIDYARFIDSFIVKKLEPFVGVDGMDLDFLIGKNTSLNQFFGVDVVEELIG